MSYFPIKNFDFKSITLVTLNQIQGTVTANYQTTFNSVNSQFLKNNFTSSVAIDMSSNTIVVPDNCYVEGFLTLSSKASISNNTVYTSFGFYDLSNNLIGVSGQSRYLANSTNAAAFVSNQNTAFTFKLISNNTGKALGGNTSSNYIIIYEF